MGSPPLPLKLQSETGPSVNVYVYSFVCVVLCVSRGDCALVASLSRVNSFLCSEEINPDHVQRLADPNETPTAVLVRA